MLKKGYMSPGHSFYRPTMNTMAKGHCVVQIEEIKMETEYVVEVSCLITSNSYRFVTFLLTCAIQV